MNKKKIIIITSIISFLIILGGIISIILLTSNKLVLSMDSLVLEYDGEKHKLEAKANYEGRIYYDYIGKDNDYHNSLEPTEPGEYLVVATFKSYDGKKNGEVKADLSITLPFELDNTGTKFISYKGNNKDVILPSKYQNKDIIEIEDNMFTNKDINSITLPKNNFKFNPNSIIDSNINYLYINEKSMLLDGIYPSNLNIEFIDEIEVLSNNIFGNLMGLDELTLPKSLERIEEDALSNVLVSKLNLYSNQVLKGINLSKTIKCVEVYSSDNNTLEESFFEGQENIETIIIDKDINTLDNKCFYNCNGLKELIVKSEITDILNNCFKNDFVLEKLTLSIPFELNKLDLEMINLVEVVDCEELAGHHFSGCTVIKKVILPDCMKVLSMSSFYKCSNLEEVVLPKELEVIGVFAFLGCERIKTIEIPNTVKEIGQSAFFQCKNLEKINIPYGIERIENNLFDCCLKLKEITIPNSVTSIGVSAFDSCCSLKKVVMSKNIETIDRSAFLDCDGLEEIILYDKVKSLGYECFAYSNNLIKIVLYGDIIPGVLGLDKGNYYRLPKEEYEYESRNWYFSVIPSTCTVYVKSELIEQYREKFPEINFSVIEE